MLEHERYDELASLAALGELAPEEHAEFLRHKETCRKCRETLAEMGLIAASTFLAGSEDVEDSSFGNERRRHVREVVAQRISDAMLVHPARRHRWIAPAGIAAAFILGIGLGALVMGHKAKTVSLAAGTPTEALAGHVIDHVAETPPVASRADHLPALVTELQGQVDLAQGENRELREKLAASDQRAADLEARLSAVEHQSVVQAQDAMQARNDLNTAQEELSKARALALSNGATIESLQDRLADREARLTEVSASLDREREMLSAGREIRDIMGARDLHIVDVIDRDGKGRTKKAFGRAFYTQGKSLIFYAFDLSPKETRDGRYVYAAWGSNSNRLGGQTPQSLGIFYCDDETQHRWSMKFSDPKTLEEIDTVFVTLEPAGQPFRSPTGKALLEAYFGTPPNHP